MACPMKILLLIPKVPLKISPADSGQSADRAWDGDDNVHYQNAEWLLMN